MADHPSSSRPGRPAYQPTKKDRRIAELMAGWAVSHERIAQMIGCDPKTLREHFSVELEQGAAKLEAELAQNLLRIARGHDRQALIATIFALKSRFGWVEAQAAPTPREREIGKKEAADREAGTAHEGTPWEELLN